MKLVGSAPDSNSAMGKRMSNLQVHQDCGRRPRACHARVLGNHPLPLHSILNVKECSTNTKNSQHGERCRQPSSATTRI